MTWTNIRKLLIEAGINTTEAAKLFGVTRQTLYNWNRKFNPDEETKERVDVISARISRALEHDELPILVAVENRKETLKTILAS